MGKYIDAEGVMRACYDSFVKTNNKAYKEIALLVEAVPAADVQEVKHGRWLMTDGYPHKVYCSECYATLIPNVEWFKTYNIASNYCPNCGASMDEVTERKCDTCVIAQTHNLEDDDTPCQNCGEDEE